MYKKKFGIKFLVSAKNKSAEQILDIMKCRLNNTADSELDIAKEEIWQITEKRMRNQPIDTLHADFTHLLNKYSVTGAQISISTGHDQIQTVCVGDAIRHQKPVTAHTWFQMASLSKTVGTCFAIEYFAHKNIPLDTPVNVLLEKAESTFRLESNWASQVTLEHLFSHTALNMHYVNGVPANLTMPDISCFLKAYKVYDF